MDGDMLQWGPVLKVVGWLCLGVVGLFVICALTVSKRVEEETDRVRAKQEQDEDALVEDGLRYR